MTTAVLGRDVVGRTIDGKFPLLERLGGSEGADVFRTEAAGPQARRAAIKLIPGDAENAESRIAAWEMAARLSHPHLVPILDCGRSQIDGVELAYVVTELHEEALSQVIPERPLNATEAGEMLGPVLDALSYLHGKGMVHGHVKPSNILVVQDQLKLSTDGITQAGKSTKSYPLRGVYSAPETAAGTLSSAADLWSLGVTLVESLTQHRPAMGSANADPVVPATVPQPFAGIARRCLQADPARRPTASQIAAFLKQGQPLPEPANEIDPVLPSGLPERVNRMNSAAPSDRRWLLVGAAALLLFAVIATWVLRSRRTEPSPVQKQPEATQTLAPPPASPAPQTPAPQGPVIKGAVIDRVLPDVSESAIKTIRGKVDVKIRVKVAPSGEVADAALDSPAPSRYFAGHALDAARKWKFKADQDNGQPIASEWILHFQFKTSGTDISAAEVSP